MNRPPVKRKRPDADPLGLADSERAVLDVIKSKRDLGIWAKEIKGKTNLPDPVFNKSMKSLLAKKLIKDVVNIQNKGKRYYMAIEFEPSKEISGGKWYVDGKLDEAYIETLKNLFYRYVRERKVATVEIVQNELKKSRVLKEEISLPEVGEILDLMVLEKKLRKLRSTGSGEEHSIPVGTVCYRVTKEKDKTVVGFASIPCGACPRISLCTPDGVISPKTCVYYTKWLSLDF